MHLVTKFGRRSTALAVVGTLAISGVAYAALTVGGAGTGQASGMSVVESAGTTAKVTFSGGPAQGSTIEPGKGVTLDLTLSSDAAGKDTSVNKVSLDSISTDPAHSACDVSVTGPNPAFSMPDSTNITIPKNGTATVHPIVTMNDTGSSQNNCLGAALTLHLSAS